MSDVAVETVTAAHISAKQVQADASKAAVARKLLEKLDPPGGNMLQASADAIISAAPCHRELSTEPSRAGPLLTVAAQAKKEARASLLGGR